MVSTVIHHDGVVLIILAAEASIVGGPGLDRNGTGAARLVLMDE